MRIFKTGLYADLEQFIGSLNVVNISEERKIVLQSLVDYIQIRVSDDRRICLSFICTHNSRRSHLAQVWAQTMATYFDVRQVECYSGGTESTALFPLIASTLEGEGFKIRKLHDRDNPIYMIKNGANNPPVIGFSKKIDDDYNPKSEFAAIMTCTQADEDCPLVHGADERISIPYEDPKIFDNTSEQAEKYSERSIQVATEMYYVFSLINTL